MKCKICEKELKLRNPPIVELYLHKFIEGKIKSFNDKFVVTTAAGNLSLEGMILTSPKLTEDFLRTFSQELLQKVGDIFWQQH